MKKLMFCLLAGLMLTAGIGQDEFFTPGYSIGGYGELHWNQEFDSNDEQTKNQLDFHRFIIYYGYNWSEHWSFKSEIELEHNYVKDGNGELELEQAFVNYHAGNWGFQGGVILPSAGLINEYHEPPLFLSVERPTYSKYIIPTTWFSNGFAFYGSYNDFGIRLALVEDLNGDGIINDGHIRGGRGKGYKTSAENWTKNLSVSYTGISGLRVGGSYTMNDAPTAEVSAGSYHTWEYIQVSGQDTEDDPSDDVYEWMDVLNENEAKEKSSLGVQLFEVNAKYDANNFHAVFEFGQISFDASSITDVDDWTSSGYYLDLGYNIGSYVNCNKLIPWLRISNVSKNVDDDSKIEDYMRIGLTWWPIDNVAFKFDYGTITKKADPDNPTTQLNMGVGYNF